MSVSRKLRVLVVEDSPTVASAVMDLLERDGFEAVSASNFAKFTEEVGKTNGQAFDVVVLDLHLPDSPDPLETWRNAVESAKYTPIIPMSSGMFSGVPVDSIVVKPDIDVLPDMIIAAVEAYSMSTLRSCLESVHALVG